MNISSSSTIHPFAFAIFPIIFLFTFNINQLSFQDIFFPLVIVFGLTFLIWISISLIIGNKVKSAFIVTIGLILFFTYGHIHNLLLDAQIASLEIERHRYLLIPFLILFIGGAIYFFKSSRKFDNLTKIVNTISIVIVVISLVNVGSFVFEQNSTDSLGETSGIHITDNEQFPDIYHIILDGYAGYNILEKYYDFKNDEFIKFLKTNDFIVPQNSKSNYAVTFLSVTSVLNMDYLNDFVEPLGKESKNQHPVYELTKNNHVMNILKNNGYKIIVIGSTVDFASEFNSADISLCGDRSYTNTEFTINLVKTSILKPIYSILFESSRDKILCSLDTLPQLHEKNDGPIFVFSHILLPHPPFQFGPNGESIDPNVIEINDDWNNKEGYINQVKFANKKISEFISTIKSENPNSIILIHGDHGTGSVNDFSSEDADIRQRMQIFNAYSFPNSPSILPYDGISLVNSYRIVFNSFFNGNYTLLEDKSFFSTHDFPYDLIDVTSKLD